MSRPGGVPEEPRPDDEGSKVAYLPIVRAPLGAVAKSGLAEPVGIAPLSERRPAPAHTPKPQRMVDVFLRYLEAEGTTHVFGIPGGLLHPLMAAIESTSAL